MDTKTRKVALIAHCLLNQNAKVCQGANYRGVVSPVVESLRSRGYELLQLPCPELAFAGVRRWWAVYEQYDTPAYRSHCRRLARAVAPLIEQHLRRGAEVILIGLDGSPSTGVRFTSSQPGWGGRPNRPQDDWEIVPRRGIWIEELGTRHGPVRRGGLARRSRAVPRRPGRQVTQDARGWRMALVPDALINPSARERSALPDVLSVLESSGYGVLQLPGPGRRGALLAVIADQVEEYVHHGYAVAAIGIRRKAPGQAGDPLHWRALAQLLRQRGVRLPPRHFIRVTADPEVEELRLAAFLAAYDLPIGEQRRWRV